MRAIIRSKEVHTQREMIEELNKQGIHCTQATISRDINDMGLEKSHDGVYMLKEDSHLKRLAMALVLDVLSVNNLVIVKTRSGMAQGVAAAVDAARMEHLLGSIAGDDTVLLVAGDDMQAQEIVVLLDILREKKGTLDAK